MEGGRHLASKGSCVPGPCLSFSSHWTGPAPPQPFTFRSSAPSLSHFPPFPQLIPSLPSSPRALTYLPNPPPDPPPHHL